MNPLEIWKDVSGYEGLYEISDLGNVRSLPRKGTKGGIIKPRVVGGYAMVGLGRGNSQSSFPVHRLVGKAFLKQIAYKNQINHKNLKKLDNRAVNLEWCNHKENMEHAQSMKAWGDKLKGSKGPASKLIEKEVLEIRRLRKEGKTIPYLAKEFKVSERSINYIVHREKWTHI